jgi:REP element-mobilizing transposase RayT
MPQSLSLVIVHIIFSTKDRHPIRDADILPSLHAYLATIARDRDCECYRVGGVADHVHLAIRLSRTITIARLIQDLKTLSSKWMKSQNFANFAWQQGYAAFSTAPKDLDALLHYIDTQQHHHHKQSFQDELLTFLKRYAIEYDKHHLWD